MDYAVLKKIAEYSDIYEVAALGISSVEEMKAALRRNGATGGTFQRRTEYLTGQPAYISINGDELSYDYQSLAEDLQTLTENLIPKGYGQDSEQELEEEIEMLKRQIADLTSELLNGRRDIRPPVLQYREMIHALESIERDLKVIAMKEDLSDTDRLLIMQKLSDLKDMFSGKFHKEVSDGDKG